MTDHPSTGNLELEAGIPEQLRAVLALDRDAPALEFEGKWHSWGAIATTVDGVAGAIPEPGFPVGILLRNRPASVGLFLGVLAGRGCVVTINPARGIARTGADIASLGLPMIAGQRDDLETLVDSALGAATIALDELGADFALRPSAATKDELHPPRPGVAVRMLTSGTTGPPKRVDLTYATLRRALQGAKYYESEAHQEVRLRAGVAIVTSPLVHLGGIFRVLQCVMDGRAFALLDRFTVRAWSDAVRRHRPQTVSLVPTALRMVLEADVDPTDLASVRSVVSGTAPLAPEDADAFTARFGIPVLITYAATEFGGSVAGWSLADYEKYGAAKPGSVGRAHPGCEVRVVDATDGRVLPADQGGLLEVKTAQLSDHTGWMRTTDLARIDEDGFLWILGRADETIIRGGLKVRPEEVRLALERHPAVRAAAVVGAAHPRLGNVPVAVVELRAGTEDIDAATLLEYAGHHLARYELPAEFRIVDELPRTSSAKVDLSAVRAMFERHPVDRDV